MFKNYRPYVQNPDQFRGWLNDGHLAFFVSKLVDSLDLSAIYRVYEREVPVGNLPYDPRMMAKLWIFGYCDGVRSSRQIEKLTFENAAYRFLAGDQHPDHNSLNSFRGRHLEALGNLFDQVLKLAIDAGLVTFEHAALDGTKVLANASKHKAMSYERMVKFDKKLPELIEKIRSDLDALGSPEDDTPSAAAQRKKLTALLARRERQKKTPRSQDVFGGASPK